MMESKGAGVRREGGCKRKERWGIKEKETRGLHDQSWGGLGRKEEMKRKGKRGRRKEVKVMVVRGAFMSS